LFAQEQGAALCCTTNEEGNAMTETLQEFCDSRGVSVRVDRQAGVIRGVKILGLQSRNGRTYLPEALVQAARLYEEAKVNVNHPKGNTAGPRDYQDRIGTIRNVAVRGGEGLFADFFFNPKHHLAEQLAWDAEHAPENVGFSHNVEARTSRRGQDVVVEAITRVESVDLVADPATTRGLFESRGAAGESGPAHTPRETPAILAALSLDELKRHRPDLVEALCRQRDDQLRKLQEQVERLKAQEALHQKWQAVRRLLREFHLPEPEATDPWARSITSPRLLESLLAEADEQAMREIVEERARLVRTLGGGETLGGGGNGRPLSRDQHLVDVVKPLDSKAFVEAIT
jgi:hypothetical protein